MSIFSDVLKLAWPLILKAAQSLADAQVKGEDLSKEQLSYLYSAYVIIKANGLRLVASTDNPYDDAGLEELASFCADTLMEASIQIPAVPDFTDDDVVPDDLDEEDNA